MEREFDVHVWQSSEDRFKRVSNRKVFDLHFDVYCLWELPTAALKRGENFGARREFCVEHCVIPSVPSAIGRNRQVEYA